MRRFWIASFLVMGGWELAFTVGCAQKPVREGGSGLAKPARTARPVPPSVEQEAPTPLEEAARKVKVKERAEGKWLVTGEVQPGAPEGRMEILGGPEKAMMGKVGAGGMMGGGMGGLKTKMVSPSARRPAEEAMAPGVAAPAAPAPTRSPRAAMRTDQARPRIAPQTTPLTAGEVDDNALFEKYLRYEQNYQAGGGVHRFDPQERYVIQVTDPQGRGVPDASVTLADPATPRVPLFRGRTTAAGKLVFFPAAYSLGPKSKLTLTASKSAEKATQTVSRQAGGGNWTISLKEPWARPTGMPLDVLFVVDTTGSMSEEIDRIRDTIQEVSRRIRDLEGKPKLRLGIVLYRDRGDDYLTKRLPFTEDVNAFETALQDVQAAGGADNPEDINSALQQAVEAMNWQEGEALRLLFLIADAPPHLDYGQEYDYFLGARRAVEKGIKIFAVSTSGMNDVGEYVFRQLALLTLGRFVFITKGGRDGITPHHVDRSDFSVEKLDDLIVRLVSEEVATLGKVLQ